MSQGSGFFISLDGYAVTNNHVVAQGAVVTMDLAPGEGEYLLSDLTSGPVLFATC